MMARLNDDQGQLFYSFCLADAVPDDHPIRTIASVLDLTWVHAKLAPYYSRLGRFSIDPVLMIRMLVVGYVFAIRSERAWINAAPGSLSRRPIAFSHLSRFDHLLRRTREKSIAELGVDAGDVSFGFCRVPWSAASTASAGVARNRSADRSICASGARPSGSESGARRLAWLSSTRHRAARRGQCRGYRNRRCTPAHTLPSTPGG